MTTNIYWKASGVKHKLKIALDCWSKGVVRSNSDRRATNPTQVGIVLLDCIPRCFGDDSGFETIAACDPESSVLKKSGASCCPYVNEAIVREDS